MPVNESQIRSSAQWAKWRDSGAVGYMPLFPSPEKALENRRRAASLEFKQGKADPRYFPRVVTYLRTVVEDFDERYSEEDLAVLEKWHGVRVAILDLDFTDKEYHKKSRVLAKAFNDECFTDSATGGFDDNKYERFKPAMTEITTLVARNF